MKGLLWLVTLFALAVGIALAAHFNEGYALLVLPPYRVELSLNLLIVIGVGGFLLFYILLRGIALTRSLPRRVREYRERQLNEKLIGSFYDAVRLLFEGRFSQALKKAAEVHAAGHLPAIAALLAARSAQRLHEPEKLKEWTAHALQVDEKMAAACLMLEAEMLVEARRFMEAEAVLEQLQHTAGRHLAALRLELRTQQGLGRSEEVLRLARLLEKHQAVLPASLAEIKREAHRRLIRPLAGDPPRIMAYLKAIPAAESDAMVVGDTARLLIAGGACDTAQRVLERQLSQAWDPVLVALYGQLPGGDPASRLELAETWLAGHGNDGALRLALGRMCLALGRWDAARAHLERAQELADLAEVHVELARLSAECGAFEAAVEHLRAQAEKRFLSV